jgi:hypothetical protein
LAAAGRLTESFVAWLATVKPAAMRPAIGNVALEQAFAAAILPIPLSRMARLASRRTLASISPSPHIIPPDNPPSGA